MKLRLSRIIGAETLQKLSLTSGNHTLLQMENWNVPNENNKRVTLHDVARHAGISKSTVSLVLRGSDAVSKKARDKVQLAIEATGYVYNRKAAAMRQTRQTDLIGVIVNDLASPYSGEILHVLEGYALGQGIMPMFASNSEALAQQDRLLQLYMEYNVGGFVLCPAPGTHNSTLEKLWRNGFKMVQIMREVPFARFPAVLADNRNGMYQATQHLIKLGHKRIAFIGGSEAISDYQERLTGFMDAMNEADLPVPSGYVHPILQSRAAGQHGLESVLKYDPQITAVVCFSDLMAYGVLNKCRELGIKVGSDLGVIGFDDLADSSLTYPALTTVQVSATDFARQAMDLLKRYMHEPQMPIERKIIPATLVVRESCGSPQTNCPLEGNKP